MASEIAVAQNDVNPLLIFQQMAAAGASMEQLSGFMALQERWELGERRREVAQDERLFNEAMVKFHLDPPKIWKDELVDFKTEKGRTTYKHATLGKVTELIAVALAKVGVSHEWIPSQASGSISVTCRLKLGMYSKDTVLSAGPDSSGGKNAIQATVSTNSYLERHTLLAATGMATHDEDNDGLSSEGKAEDDVRAEVDRQKKSTPTAGEVFSPKSSAPPELEWSYVASTGVLICRIVDVKLKTKKTGGGEFLAIKINGKIDEKDMLFYWHATHRSLLLSAKGKIIKAVVTPSGDTKQISELVQVDGQPVPPADEDAQTKARLLASALDLTEDDLSQLMTRFAKGNWSTAVQMLEERKAALEAQDEATA